MVIYYLLHMAMAGVSADISYNAAWMSLWSYAELSLGILVTCTLSVPKFAEAEGERIRRVYRRFTTPVRLSSVAFSKALLRTAKEDEASATSDSATRDGTGLERVHADAIEKDIGRLV